MKARGHRKIIFQNRQKRSPEHVFIIIIFLSFFSSSFFSEWYSTEKTWSPKIFQKSYTDGNFLKTLFRDYRVDGGKRKFLWESADSRIDLSSLSILLYRKADFLIISLK